MADWKQITARIRRARTSKDPAAQLSALYEKTHDAMVAFELAKYFESTALNADAAKWYAIAAERFRRADWKTKAQEAAVRLGGIAGATPESTFTQEDAASVTTTAVPMPDPGLPFEQTAAAFSSIAGSGTSGTTSDISTGVEAPAAELTAETNLQSASPRLSAGANPDEKRRRTRGRRGGRNRRKDAPVTGSDASTPVAASSRTSAAHSSQSRRSQPRSESPAASDITEPDQRPATHSRAMPTLPIETLPELAGGGPKGRYGDP
ncbi:MAG: hypothetical protein M3N22_01010, partial [Acidobacteriota bacterium]|nr:hypothetical protein [Acidobacteriota bacterium]